MEDLKTGSLVKNINSRSTLYGVGFLYLPNFIECFLPYDTFKQRSASHLNKEHIFENEN